MVALSNISNLKFLLTRLLRGVTRCDHRRLSKIGGFLLTRLLRGVTAGAGVRR